VFKLYKQQLGEHQAFLRKPPLVDNMESRWWERGL